MPIYQKKSEVRRLKNYIDDKQIIVDFCNGDAFVDNDKLLINTLEGVVEAVPGDWIVEGTNKEFYPISPKVYEEGYNHLDGDNYQRKPIFIEGFQFGYNEIPDWVKKSIIINPDCKSGTLVHRDNVHNFKLGCYILLNIENDPYVCQEKEFDKSFIKIPNE